VEDDDDDPEDDKDNDDKDDANAIEAPHPWPVLSFEERSQFIEFHRESDPRNLASLP
jgi:hypothetical protein